MKSGLRGPLMPLCRIANINLRYHIVTRNNDYFSEGRATLEEKLTEDEMLHLWLSSMVKVDLNDLDST